MIAMSLSARHHLRRVSAPAVSSLSSRSSARRSSPSWGRWSIRWSGLALLLLGISTAIPANAFAGTDSDLELSLFSAIVLGLVEGLTEYLPVSSTGHLLMTNEVLGLNVNAEAERLLDTYAIGIQAGAILAVLVVYKDRILQLFDGLLGRSEEGRRILLAILASFIPTAIIAKLIFDPIREHIFSPGYIALAWLVGGIGILVLSRTAFFDRAKGELAQITVKQAIIIGLLQAIAVWPGVSRSLVTIIAGVLVGLSLRAAVEYSFLLGLLTLTAATAFAALSDGGPLIEEFGLFTPIVGLVVAFVSAVVAVRWMVAWLNDRGFEVFGWYRIASGLLTFVAIGLGWLSF